MQATIEKHAYWKFIAAVVVVPLSLIALPHLLFPQTAEAHMGKFLLLSTVLSIVLLIYIYKIIAQPIKLLTLLIANGEFALKEGDKVILSEFESHINLVLAKHKPYQMTVPPQLLLKFMNQHNKLLLRIYVEAAVRHFHSDMSNTPSEFHTSDNWGKYQTNKTEALKILKYYGCEGLVTFE